MVHLSAWLKSMPNFVGLLQYPQHLKGALYNRIQRRERTRAPSASPFLSITFVEHKMPQQFLHLVRKNAQIAVRVVHVPRRSFGTGCFELEPTKYEFPISRKGFVLRGLVPVAPPPRNARTKKAKRQRRRRRKQNKKVFNRYTLLRCWLCRARSGYHMATWERQRAILQPAFISMFSTLLHFTLGSV